MKQDDDKKTEKPPELSAEVINDFMAARMKMVLDANKRLNEEK